jgi:hypothetical protein
MTNLKSFCVFDERLADLTLIQLVMGHQKAQKPQEISCGFCAFQWLKQAADMQQLF